MSLLDLWLPIVLSGLAMFLVSFLSWMIFHLHHADWQKLPAESEFLSQLKERAIPPGNYMFPFAATPEEYKSPEFLEKQNAGPSGIISLFSGMRMAQSLIWTFIYYMFVSMSLAYLASITIPAGVEQMILVRFFATASILVHVSSVLLHSIWFGNRITGHVVDSLLHALVTTTIFVFLWPK